MVAANKQHLPSSSTSSAKNPKNPNPSSDAAMKNYSSSFASTSTSAAAASSSSQPDSAAILPLSVDGSEEEDLLRQSEFLTREEVLQRRSRRVKQLERYYRSQYWALMEEVRAKHRDYYWEYGKSPFMEEGEEEEAGWPSGRAVAAERSGENGGRRLGLGLVRNGKGGERDVKWKRCGFQGCKAKAMALTSFCHLHILSDPKQKLYKPCTYVVKRFRSFSLFLLFQGFSLVPCWISCFCLFVCLFFILLSLVTNNLVSSITSTNKTKLKP